MSEPVTRQLLSGKLDGGANQLAHISLIDGKNNTYIGLSSGASRPLAGGNNTYIGGFSGANATADATVLIGTRAGRVGKSIREGIFIGFRAGEFAERVDSSVCIGPYAGQKMKRANNNCVIGYRAGAELTSGSRNTALGAYASFQQFNGTDNVCVGFRSGYKNRIGANNCYVGSNSGFSAVSGYENVCLGVGSGQFLTAGTKNVLCGFLAGNAISNASNCIAIGTRAMEFFDSGDTNTCLGTETARRLTGNNNTILGGYTASNAAGSFNTVVGSRSMNRTNNWKVDLENSVIVGENVQFNLPVSVIGLTYENATAPVTTAVSGVETGALDLAQKIVPFDRLAGDQLGQSIAVSADGNYIVVGTYLAPGGTAVGAAYVYVKSGTVWEMQQKLPTQGVGSGQMAVTASISADGSYIVLGGLNRTESTGSDGVAYVFVRTGSSWALQQRILASVPTASDLFGYSGIDISGPGDVIIAGAWGQDTNAAGGVSLVDAGAVYFFSRAASLWTFNQKVVPTDRAGGDRFGSAVSISADATIALVGAPLQATNATGGVSLAAAGAAYILTKTSGVWSQTQKLVASDRTAGDRFGTSVAISGNGSYAIVGAYLNKTNAAGASTLLQAGAVYIFTRAGGVWTQQAKVVAFDRAVDDFFGVSVAISGDGRYALASAYGNDTNATGGTTLAAAGAVYLLVRQGASWTSQRKIVASDRAAGDNFGRNAVSLSDSGLVVAVGAPFQDTNATGGATLSNAGAAYVYYTSGNVSQLVDATLDTGLVGTEDISYFMRNTLTSPTHVTPSIGSAHRARIAFEVDTAPTLDTLAPYERYISFGFANDSTAAWTTNAKAKAGPMTVRVGTTGTSTPNPPNGIYRLRWNHNVTDFPAFAYQDPSRYDLYIEPGPSAGLRAVTHTIDGELVAVNGALLAMSSASGDGRSLAAGGTIATVTTAAPHGLAVGTIISLGSIADPVLTPGVTGIWEVTSVTTSTLTFTTMADGATTIALGTAKLYVCPRFVSTNAHTVFVRLQIDGRTAIAFTIPKPLDYGYLDFAVEQTNPAYGASVPELNLMVRHAPIPPGVSFVAQAAPAGYFDVPGYITFTITGNIDDPLAVACRTLPGSPFPLDSTSIAVQGGIATFSSQAGLIDPETEADLYADWRANFPEGGAPYNSSAYSRWLNHKLIICGGEIHIANSTTPYLNGTWKVKGIVGSTFTIDVSDLKLADAQYPVGVSCLVYPARVFFNRVTDGLRFLVDTDAEFLDRFGSLVTEPNPRRVYMRAARGHDLEVGSTVFLDGAADARLNGCFDILECPALDPLWYDPDPTHPDDYTGQGRDHWAVFELDFDPDDPIETMTGANIVQYVARLDPSIQYATIDGFTNDAPGSAMPQMAIRTANTVNMVTYASKSDLSLINVAVSGPTLGDGHVHLGFGSLSAMNANIGVGQLEFTDLGMSRAVYTVGDFNKTLAVSGTWGLSGSMTFGIDWLSEYAITCVKEGTALDFFATRTSGVDTVQQVAQIGNSAVALHGNITGEAVPLQIADVMATAVPRLTLGFVHNFTARTLDINFLAEGGSIVNNVFEPTVSHVTRIELRNVGETLYAPGTTIEFFSNAFTTLANLSISSTQIRESPVFANVVYLGSSHTVTAEEDRHDVLIASLGPNRLIRANIDTFRIYSSSLTVGNISFGNGASTFGSVAQITQAKTGATGVVVHDYAISSVFYHSALAANFTCSVINVPITNDRNSPLTLVLAQGSTPYMANALQINGLATTISWFNGTAPTGNASKTNLVTFAMLRAANAWTVLGKSEVFG